MSIPKLLFLFALSFSLLGCREVVFHDLDELQANRMIVVLGDANIDSTKIKEGARWKISVPTNQIQTAIRLIDSSRLLTRELSRSMEEPRGILASKEERNSYLERKSAWALEQTLETIPGVLEARIHFFVNDSTEATIIPRPSNQSASALLVVNGQQSVTEGQVRTIISGASGTKPEAVSVIFSQQNTIEQSDDNEITVVSTKESENLLMLLIKNYSSAIIFTSLGLVFVISTILTTKRKKTKRSNEGTHNHVAPAGDKLPPIDPLSTVHAYDMNISDLI